MLLMGFRKEIFRAKCNPGFESLHCYAHLNEDVGEAIPYLNAEMGGYQFIIEPPSVTFKIHGRLITIHSKMIALNALKDEAEADKILNWLKNQINEIWERRNEITPLYETTPKPQVFEILKLLPKTNCKECGQPTCMVFAVQVIKSVKGVGDCPQMNKENRIKLTDYLKLFKLDYDVE